ncbi:uncharacterized protein C6orf118-like [Hoplias malabaricus]|uniref:uncharacterized protein C6orf118-like n=1 Tax=Hoplias malabaricus TaxID=27720 RepID=UPI0034637013
MSVSGREKPRLSDFLRERKDLLLCAETGNKMDIHTYSAGHLGPYSFNHKPVQSEYHRPIWEKSVYLKSKSSGLSPLQESRDIEVNVEEMKDALLSFTMSTTLQNVHSGTGCTSITALPRVVDPHKKKVLETTELFLMKPSSLKQGSGSSTTEVDQGRYWFTQSYQAGLTCSDQLRLWKQFDRQVVRKQDLVIQNCLSGRGAAEPHQRKLLEELRKVPVCGGPCRERLSIFSDVFSDICDSSSAFGSILREIKTEYDLYLGSVITSHSPFTNSAASLPLGSFSKTAELEEAARQVSSLEEGARRALEENDRVRIEYEDAQTKAMKKQKESAIILTPTVRVSGRSDGGQSVLAEGGLPNVKKSETEVSSMDKLECKMQQVWRMWIEVQNLQKEVRETMVSTVTTSSLHECIRDTEAEIKRLIDSNEQLRSTKKELEENISKVLHRAKISEKTKVQVWEKIWDTVNGGV